MVSLQIVYVLFCGKDSGINFHSIINTDAHFYLLMTLVQ